MTDDARLPGFFPRRWGADAPIEMRPKSTPIVDIEVFFDNPELLDAIERGQEEMQRNARQFVDQISQYEDAAALALLDAGVAKERITRYVERSGTERGYLIDCPPDAANIAPYIAWSLTTKFVNREDRYEIQIDVKWHGEWERRMR